MAAANPRLVVMLSAVPRDAWSPTQGLCFSNVKGRTGLYLGAAEVFPNERQVAAEPELLPEEPERIVQLAVAKAKELPVLFYGSSSVYADF